MNLAEIIEFINKNVTSPSQLEGMRGMGLSLEPLPESYRAKKQTTDSGIDYYICNRNEATRNKMYAKLVEAVGTRAIFEPCSKVSGVIAKNVVGEQSMNSNRVCKGCGTNLLLKSRFCHECGKQYEQTEELYQNKDIDDHLFFSNSNNMEKLPMANETIKYNSYWSKLYGNNAYIEYKGYIYCIIPESEITGKDYQYKYYQGSYEGVKSWVLVRFKDNGIREIVHRFNIDHSFCSTTSFCIKRKNVVSYSIYDNKIYYFRDFEDEKSYTEIISLDINTKKESVTLVSRNDRHMRTYGIFKGRSGEVYVNEECNYDTDSNAIYISNLDGKRKQLGDAIEIEGYNEEYIYYFADNDLYSVNLNTFEIDNLSKITKKGDFYGINTQNDIIYVTTNYLGNQQKVIAINRKDEIVEEIVVPQLSDCSFMSKTEKEIKKSFCRIHNDDGEFFFFNGEYWIVRINPEIVDVGMSYGIILFDKNGREIGKCLNNKVNNYIARCQIRFMLPSSVAIMYKLVYENGEYVDFGTILLKKMWVARMFYLKKNEVKDSKIDLYYLHR